MADGVESEITRDSKEKGPRRLNGLPRPRLPNAEKRFLHHIVHIPDARKTPADVSPQRGVVRLHFIFEPLLRWRRGFRG